MMRRIRRTASSIVATVACRSFSNSATVLVVQAAHHLHIYAGIEPGRGSVLLIGGESVID